MNLTLPYYLKCLIIIVLYSLSSTGSLIAQESTTYSVDPNFDALDFVRGYAPVIGVHDVGDGTVICYGLMNPSPIWNTTDDRGFAHLYSDGSEAPWLEAESQSVQYLLFFLHPDLFAEVLL